MCGAFSDGSHSPLGIETAAWNLIRGSRTGARRLTSQIETANLRSQIHLSCMTARLLPWSSRSSSNTADSWRTSRGERSRGSGRRALTHCKTALIPQLGRRPGRLPGIPQPMENADRGNQVQRNSRRRAEVLGESPHRQAECKVEDQTHPDPVQRACRIGHQALRNRSMDRRAHANRRHR